MNRRGRLRFWWCSLLLGAQLLAGCAQSAMRSQSPEDFERVLADVKLVGDVSQPFGLHPLVIQSVGLVANLPNTGSDPAPGVERSMIIAEMQRRQVERPNEVLASLTTALVHVGASLPPGLQKGERFDIYVSTPEGTETTSLRSGVLLESRLREMASGHEGSVLGLAQGPLIVDPQADEQSDGTSLLRARIVDGGIALRNRPLGIMIKTEDRSVQTAAQSVQTAAQIGAAINQRFHIRVHGSKKGVADPKTDRYVELAMYPRYKNNIIRYFSVIRSLALNETPSQRRVRTELLERQLLDAVTSAAAALKLEAIGKEAKDSLRKGLASSDPEVRFYAAEALAYLDDPAAIDPLAAAARDESAFRARAMTALSAMEDPMARDGLAGLLDSNSAETRYGAFRALWTMNSRDPLVQGEKINDELYLHQIRSKGQPLVHLARVYRPEIVLFGAEAHLKAPLILHAGNSIVVRDLDGGRLAVSRFAPGVPDQRREIGNSVSELIRAISEVGGNYADVFQALTQARSSGALSCRLEIDAVPRNDRPFVRPDDGGPDQAEGNEPTLADLGAFAEPVPPPRLKPAGFPVDSPSPDLFPTDETPDAIPTKKGGQTPAKPSDDAAEDGASLEPPGKEDEAKQAWPLTRRLGKMLKPWAPAEE